MGTQRYPELAPGNVLQMFVGAFVDELARCGVTDVCLCPGSRSTPLALLLRDHPDIKVWPHLDERSAAFFALGIAKASHKPAAIVATSGTAAANFTPAIVEAYYAHVPLLVLTADRPLELRSVGANQTIDQVRMYGSNVKWSVEALMPEATPEAIRYSRTLAARAVAMAIAPSAGPVHINFPFREPLTPTLHSDLIVEAGFASREGKLPYVSIRQGALDPDATTVASLAQELADNDRGMIVCGPQTDGGFPAAVTRLAKALGYPVLADPLSQVRCGPHHTDLIIDSYDAFLRDADTTQSLALQVVLRFGATPTSKALLTYLERHADSRQILIAEGEGWNDPSLVASDMIRANPLLLCETLTAAIDSSNAEAPAASDWLKRWQAINEHTRDALQGEFRSAANVSEPGVFAALADALPDRTTVFAGNSMPVRDLDTFLPGSTHPRRFLANRGASGIDGVVSSALGASAASAGPLLLVIGDLSFYHDMNGLLAIKQHKIKATIVLINNDGGGIFSFLLQAEQTNYFEELFGTPHGLDFRPAAEMYGLAYQRVETTTALRDAIALSVASEGSTLIEVRTSRTENVRLHQELWQKVSQALRSNVPG